MLKKTIAVVALLTAAWFASVAHASADSRVTVAPGETLFRIAVRYGTTVDALVQANGLSSANRILAGQTLTVPSGSSAAYLPASQPAGSSAAGAHRVGSGETLARIASLYGTTPAALVAANGLASPDMIFEGQLLTIPGASSPPAAMAAPSLSAGGGERTIIIELSSQTLSALEGGVPVRRFTVSTGSASTPTPIGTFWIYSRYASQLMSGPGYSVPGVPHVQYFTGDYAIHGAYWHTSFGAPVSHGCVNLRPDDAAWLWSWADIGTPVTVRW